MENKITAILVDDEEQSRVVLKMLLNVFKDTIDVVGEADSVASAYDLVNEKKPQLVFLDIQMPRANGFSLLKKYDEIPFEVIFVTSFDKYAINAIKFSALDYLLKPVEMSDLMEAIRKAVKIINSKKNRGTQIVNLLHNLNTDLSKQKIAIQAGDAMRFVDTASILYIEGEGSYSNLIAVDSERFVLAKYLKDFEEYLGESSSFVRIHRSCMINAKFIKGYSTGEPCIIEMKDGKTFEVARRKKHEVLEKLRLMTG